MGSQRGGKGMNTLKWKARHVEALLEEAISFFQFRE